ncbi:MAG: DUF5367 family protein [Pseudomonadota bacterium]
MGREDLHDAAPKVGHQGKDIAQHAEFAFWFVFGFVVWLAATIAFALIGDLFFERGAIVYAVFIGFVCSAAVSLFGIVAHMRKLRGKIVLQAAVTFSIAGMLGEIPVMMTFPKLVPALAAETAGAYSGFLFLGYSALLTYALAAGRVRRS